MAIREIIIYTEDTYGVDFFKNLIERLIKENFVSDLIVKCQRLAGKCWEKTKRQINSSGEFYEKIIIIIDGEGSNRNEVFEDMKQHIPNYLQQKVHIIIFEYMIEEWICQGFNIRFRNRPSEDLSNWLRNEKGYKYSYKKNKLPEFANKIDISQLEENTNFTSLLNILRDG